MDTHYCHVLVWMLTLKLTINSFILYRIIHTINNVCISRLILASQINHISIYLNHVTSVPVPCESENTHHVNHTRHFTIFQRQCMIDDANLMTVAYFMREQCISKVNNYFLVTNITKYTQLNFFFHLAALTGLYSLWSML